MVHQLACPGLQASLRLGAETGLGRLGRDAAAGFPARLPAAAGGWPADLEATLPAQSTEADQQGSGTFSPGQPVAHTARPALYSAAAPAGQPLHTGGRSLAHLLWPAQPQTDFPDHPQPRSRLSGVQRLPGGDAPGRHCRIPLPHSEGRVAGQAHQHALPLAAAAAPHHALYQGRGRALVAGQRCCRSGADPAAAGPHHLSGVPHLSHHHQGRGQHATVDHSGRPGAGAGGTDGAGRTGLLLYGAETDRPSGGVLLPADHLEPGLPHLTAWSGAGGPPPGLPPCRGQA